MHKEASPLGRRMPGQTLRIVLSRHVIEVARTSRWSGATVALARQAFSPEDAGAHHDHQALAIALRDVLAPFNGPGAGLSGWPVHIVLADELVRMWQVTPPRQAARLADIEAAAALRFFALYGEPASGWRLAGDWDSSAPFFAAAIPKPLLAMLEHVAQEAGMVIVAVQPHLVAAWNHWRRAVKPGAWFAQVHDSLLALCATDGGRLRTMRSVPLPAGADHAWLTQVVRREALLVGSEAPALVQMCGDVPTTLAGAPAQDQIAVAILGAALAGEVRP